jgi:Tfp pilus assembly protein PilX
VLPLPGVRDDDSAAQLDLEIELIMSMSKQTLRMHALPPMARSQRGTMLIIALIVLVAMTLAGIATMRSVDTATVMAGNIAFRQSALNAADQGLQAGYVLLQTPSPASDLTKDGSLWAAPVVGYLSNTSLTEPTWTDPNAWTNAAQLNGGAPDAAGNVVSFLVQRLCLVANCAAGATCGGTFNQCGSTVSTATLNREGSDNFRAQDAAFASQPQVHYRITARAVGPRASVAIVQTLAR